MAENLEKLEAEIRSFLLDHGKGEMVSGGFKISLKEREIEIIELPSANLKQLKLPINIKQPEKLEKGERNEIRNKKKNIVGRSGDCQGLSGKTDRFADFEKCQTESPRGSP